MHSKCTVTMVTVRCRTLAKAEVSMAQTPLLFPSSCTINFFTSMHSTPLTWILCLNCTLWLSDRKGRPYRVWNERTVGFVSCQSGLVLSLWFCVPWKWPWNYLRKPGEQDDSSGVSVKGPLCVCTENPRQHLELGWKRFQPSGQAAFGKFCLLGLISEPWPVLFRWTAITCLSFFLFFFLSFSSLASLPFAIHLLEREGNEIGRGAKREAELNPACDKNLWKIFQRAFLWNCEMVRPVWGISEAEI